MCWKNFQCRCVLLILPICIIVEQGPIALAEGAGGGCLDILFSLVCYFSFLSPSLGDDPVSTEILSQRAVKPKTTSHQTNQANIKISI